VLQPAPAGPGQRTDHPLPPADHPSRSGLRPDPSGSVQLPGSRAPRPVADRSYRLATPTPRFARAFAATFAFFFAATLALAQSVSWDPPAGSLARGQTSALTLVFDNCSPAGDTVALPTVPGLEFGRPSQSSQTSIVNFKMSKRVTLAYPVLPSADSGRIVIPEFEVETDKGKQRVAAAAYEIGEATVGRSNVPIERVASAAVTAEPAVLWAGQVFDLKYRLLISRKFNPTGVGPLDWTPPAHVIVDTPPAGNPQLGPTPLGRFENIEATVGGDPRVGLASQTRACITEPGTHQLPVARQPVTLATGGGNAFDFFGRQSAEQYLITSTAPSLIVKPLPAPAPAGFLQAVGQFTFTGKVVPTTAAVGEPVTWTLTLEGTGNWPAGLGLPAREVSRDFRAFQPNVQRKLKDGTLFEGSLTEDIVLMPTKPGTYTLGPVSYSYFDPVAGAYKTVRTPAVKVTITPPAPANPITGATANGTNSVFQFTPDTAATTGSAPVVKSPAPELPGHLPLEPLTGPAASVSPWPRLPWALLLAPLPPLLVLWLALGWRRARLTDPRRDQRAALAALPAALAAVQSAPDAPARSVALREWQQLAAAACAADHAAPAPEAFAAAVRRELVGATAEHVATWERLWREADATLYGRQTALPADWAVRALAAQNAARLRRRGLFAPLHPSNLWPLPLVALLLLTAPPRAEATGAAEDSYRRAEFANAEQTWRASLAVAPDDWKLRHNLGLALAQQDRWSEAAAQWSVAFLAAPRDPSVRWHLALGLERAEFTQPEFATLSAGTGLAGLARLAPPAIWQRIVVTGSALLGLALAAVLLARHLPPQRRRLDGAAALLAFAGVLALASGLTALREYGPLAHPDAVLVWKAAELRSVPTEAGEQKPEPLAAGTIAIRQKSFFGWDQLLFANGQTGWTRRESLQPLHPRPAKRD